MDDAITPGGDSPIPQLDFATLAAMMQAMANAGWVWDEKSRTIAHPRDPQLYFFVDPATHRPSLSAKLAQRLAAGLGPQPEEEQP